MVNIYKPKNEYFPPFVLINDIQAYKHYHLEKYLILYDRFYLNKLFNYKCGLIQIDNDDIYTEKEISYPIIIKKRINLIGMSKDTFTINNRQEYLDWNTSHEKMKDQFFWSNFHFGNHYSTDIVIINGQIKFSCTFYGNKINNYEFDYWKLIYNHQINQKIITIISSNLQDFTGIINYEEIDQKIIEIHLRMGDIYHLSNIGNSIIKLYKEKIWDYTPKIKNESVNLFTIFEGIVNVKYLTDNYLIDSYMIEKILSDASYYQSIDSFENFNRIRMMMFKCDNFYSGKRMQKNLRNYIDEQLKKKTIK